jgi:glutamate-ammonia-ligase adenylyltransferase
MVAGQAFLDRLTPFVWRKHLDFAAIEDAHNMRLRIREHKGLGGPITLQGHDMKLGPGGIREIEFFTQTRQIIAGGREPSLRQRGTIAGLSALADGGWVTPDVSTQLAEDYRHHRMIEHRLQMVADAQTHAVPNSDEGFLRLARLVGTEDVGTFREALRERLDRVHSLTEPFFAPGSKTTEVSTTHADTAARWTRFPALRSERARARFERLRPMLFQRLDAAPHPSEAIAAFEGFLAGLPAGVQLFSLFEASPPLVELIVDIASTAPGLAQYLGRNAQVLDAVLGGSFFSDWPGAEALRDGLSSTLSAAADYESQLDVARRWMKEWHFRIGVHHLRGLIDAVEAGEQYADLADAVLQCLLPVATQAFAAKHGTPPGRGAAIIGMGSLGSRLLSSESDLDLIVIYDAQGIENSDGRRPLATRVYYARLTQAFITALSAPMAEGKLYEVDMRLRPSGRQGPVATGLGAFQQYQRDEAWGWEHLALTRARPISGVAELRADIETFRSEFLGEIGEPDKVLADIRDMRHRLDIAKPRGTVWDIKEGAGGRLDIELFAQGAALVAGNSSRSTVAQLGAAIALGWIDQGQKEELVAAYRLQSTLLISLRLLKVPDPGHANFAEGGKAFLLRGQVANKIDALENDLQIAFDSASKIIGAVLDMPS